MADTVCSSRAIPRGAGTVASLAACIAALTAVPAMAQTTPAPVPPPAVAGTNGLWVSLQADSAIVRWMTDSAEAGSLMVRDGSHVIAHRVTEPERVHRASFALGDLDTVEIRFGIASSDTPEFTSTMSLRPPARPGSVFPAADTLFVLGDTHGAYEHLIAGLQTAGILDARKNWAGGRKHVVFAGDLTDRGPDVLRLLWFVYNLERQARAAGGDVHVLLGNHEIMVMLADLRYVHPKELDIAERYGARYDELLDPHTSLLGRWLASKPAVIRIGDIVIVHGGVAPEHARLSIEALNDTLAYYLRTAHSLDSLGAEPLDSIAEQARHDFFFGERSVFWHRDYVRMEGVEPEIDETLRLWSARTMVVGHTPVPTIRELHGGRVIAAHTPQFGAELLMLVTNQGDLQRFRIRAGSAPERF